METGRGIGHAASRIDDMTERNPGPSFRLAIRSRQPARRGLLTAWLLAAALVAGPASAAPRSQSERAIAAVQQLIASGEVARDTVLSLGFKQGNINAFLGNDLELQKEWEQKTGIVLETRIIPQEPAKQFITRTPGIDLTVARNHEFTELLPLGLIEDLTPLFEEFGFELEDDRQSGYIRPDLQAYLGDRIAAIPADGDVVVMYLRRDLMEDPAERAAFRKATGRDLAPPETWQEYEELVRFFHRPDRGLYGAVEERDPDAAWMLWLPRYLSQATPYQPLFDENMRPLIASPEGLAATESYITTVRYSPPGITDKGNNYSFTMPLYMRGKAFAVMNTLATAKLLNGDGSLVHDKYLPLPIPGTRIDGKLVRRNTIIYGNNLVIPQGAGNRKLAFLYAMWITSPEISARSVGVRGGFTDPYRWHHLNDPRIVEVYTEPALQVFADAWPFTLPPGTGLPGDSDYLAVLDLNLTKAARGEQGAAEAMQRTAEAWELITDRLGRDQQVRHWKDARRNYRIAP
jgi:multiple sugar transport system substrate-binding protein